METGFFSALLSIIIIDLVLAGDNAIVIGLAARNLPANQQKKVIVLGTAGAVVLRIIATALVVWLLKIPGLLLIGGIALLWIACKLLTEEKSHDMKAETSLWAAIRTIIIADTVMGIDNVLAVAGAAHGDFWLVVLGLLISVPIMVWGSTMVLKLIERFPFIIYIGAAVLAYTAASMITGEKLLANWFASVPMLDITVTVIAIVGVLVFGYFQRKKSRNAMV